MVDVSVVIPTHNRVESVLAAIRSCLLQREISFEVIVVSNPRLKQLEDRIKALNAPAIRFFSINTPNVSMARNLGIEMAAGQYIYFLDDDCRLPDDDFLNLSIKQIKVSVLKIMGGAYMDPPDSGRRIRAYNKLCNLWLAIYETQVVLGGNFIVEKEVLGQGLRFNENLDFGGEEIDFCRKLKASGCGLFVSKELSVLHDPPVKTTFQLIYQAWKQSQLPKTKLKVDRDCKISILKSIKNLTCFETVFVLAYLIIGRISYAFFLLKLRVKSKQAAS